MEERTMDTTAKAIGTAEDETAAMNATRSKNKVRMLHHHAFLARNLEETRHFYEDILGMPLIGTWVERVNPVTGKPDNYAHAFFELSDGSSLAFFQFKSDASVSEISVNKFSPISPFGHHFAMEVDGKETVLDFKKRLDEAGFPSFLTDHGYCYSVYCHDPNGMQVELTTKVGDTQEMMDEAGRNAHATMRRWLEEDDVATNNTRRGAGWVKA
jgi:glyoxylase I family protein